MKTMRELLGPDKLFHLNGSIHWLDPRAAQYFDRFCRSILQRIGFQFLRDGPMISKTG